MKQQPWMKFYPADWRSDPKLRMCSLAARGLWADMLALMHEATPYGHLLVNGAEPTPRQLAVLVGATQKEVERLTAELEEAGVFSRNEGDIIFSRRMVRDKAKDERYREYGKRGGNPNLKADDNGGVNPPPKGNDKASRVRNQKPEARNQSSEASASGGTPPPDPVKASFDYGVEILTAGGISEKQARSLVGKWRRDIGDHRLMPILMQAKNGSVTSPLEYIAAGVEREKRGARPRSAVTPLGVGG